LDPVWKFSNFVELDELYLLMPKYRVFEMGKGVRKLKNRQNWPKNWISA